MMLRFVLVWVLMFGLATAARLSAVRKANSSLVELSADDVLNSLADWTNDMAFMTYRPNCEYCESLEPIMEAIADLLKENSNLVVGRLNCELSKSHSNVCSMLKLAYYPSIYFIGFGDMNQGGTSGHLVGQPKYVGQRVVRFTAAMIPEAIYDWIRLLSTISSWQRRWANFKGFFTGKSGARSRIDKLQQQISVLKRKNEQLSEELQRLQADRIFDELIDHGDVFPLLHTLEPDENNLPLRVCVVDMVSEYCKYHPEESYCRSFDRCERQKLLPTYCRPEVCPFENKKGCAVVSTCMQPSVIGEYKNALKSAVN